MQSFTAIAGLTLTLLTLTTPLQAQIGGSTISSTNQNRVATLQKQLTNRLRATRTDQRAYINHIAKLVKQGRVERSLVVALERYALRRSPGYPFPFFERAMKYECGRRGVSLPPVKQFANTRSRGPN